MQSLFKLIGLFCSSLLARTTFIPVHNGRILSKTNISKHIVVIETTHLSLRGILSHIAYIKLITLDCFNSTPLGLPVEPEVYIIYPTSSGKHSVSKDS